MTLSALHDLSDFGDLVRVVAAKRGIAAGMVEKDYWVVHCLAAIRDLGWGIHFKGGTSLSKAYGIIQRFSEDLDLKVEPPAKWRLSDDHNWKSDGKEPVSARQRFFDRLVRELQIPGCQVAEESRDRRCRAVGIRVRYPSVTDGPPPPLRPGVLLEIGSARVVPNEMRRVSSWVAEYVAEMPGDLALGAPDHLEVRCVLPAVTLLEKIDAVSRHYPGTRDAASFVRHYEDAAAIVHFLAQAGAPSPAEFQKLHDEMVETQDIRPLDPGSDALRMSNPARNAELERAWDAAASLHWGERRSLLECAQAVRSFLQGAGIGE